MSFQKNSDGGGWGGGVISDPKKLLWIFCLLKLGLTMKWCKKFFWTNLQQKIPK